MVIFISYRGTYSWNKLFDMADETHGKILLKVKNEVDMYDICDIQFTSVSRYLNVFIRKNELGIFQQLISFITGNN